MITREISTLAPKRSSEKRAREMIDELVETAREMARDGKDVAPGSASFWQLMGGHLAEVGDLLGTVNEEVREEQEANLGKTTRSCVVCEEPVVKRHKRGRWPLYCDTCKLKDRTV